MILLPTRLLSFAFILGAISFCCAQNTDPSRITDPIDTTRLVRLGGSVPPLAKPEFDQGRLNGNTIIHGVTLIFRRSLDQEKALASLLAAQQDRTSTRYHRWLTPEQFAD